MKHFFEIQHQLLKATPTHFERFLKQQINLKNRMIGIVGPRGVGKTTLMLQFLRQLKNDLADEQILYVSLDHFAFSEKRLFDFASQFVREHNGQVLLLDEVHKYSNWNQELKNIYDSFPHLRVIFSGSSSLDLIKGRYDLSRRAILYHLPGLSFREYVNWTYDLDLPVSTIPNLLKEQSKIYALLSEHHAPLQLFKTYLQRGYYPFTSLSSEKEVYYEQIRSVIEKTIFIDIAGFYKLKTQNLQLFRKILAYICTIPPGKIKTNNLAKHLQIANETVSEYLEYLRDTSLIRYLPIDALGSKLIRNAEKVFLDNPNMHYALSKELAHDASIGQVRELFCLNQFQNAGLNPTYLEQGDMKCGKWSFEIGGRNKTWEQLKMAPHHILLKDDITVGTANEIPLYMMGLLY